MKIVGVECFVVALPRRREHTWASNVVVPIGRHALVRVDTDEGVSGWGEAAVLASWGGAHGRYYGETPQTVVHLVRDYLAPAIEGCDPLDLGVVHARMDAVLKGHPYAKAAIDTACYDAAGRFLGVPVASLLGGAHRDGVQLAHSLGLMDTRACLDEAAAVVAEGTRAIKVKTGKDTRRDVDVVEALRNELGDDVAIRVDANEGYASVADAVRVTKQQEEFGILLCEQPVPSADGLAEIRRAVDAPIMADESAWNSRDILALSAAGAIDCFSCYVAKAGGLYKAHQMGRIAADLGIYCDVGGSVEMGIGNAASLHLAASLPNAWLPSVTPVTTVAGDPGPSTAGVYYTDDVVTQTFGFEDGRVMLPTGPGLGVEVDVAKLDRYAA